MLHREAALVLFEVLGMSGTIIQVRTAYLFEVGEELHLRIEADGQTSTATARVRGHRGPSDARITELELSARSAPGRAAGA